MNAIHKLSAPFDLTPTPDLEALGSVFRSRAHVRIFDILRPSGALALYEHLAQELAWRPVIFSSGRLLSAAAAAAGGQSHPLDEQARARAYEGAERGSAYLHDVDRLFPEDVPESLPFDNGLQTGLLAEFRRFANSPPFLDLAHRVTGTAIERVEIQATRHRRGHFSTFVTLPPSVGDTSAVSFGFDLTLTLEWSSDWGGVLTFRGQDVSNTDGYVPAFNALDIYALPQGHWISAVTDFAGGNRLAIAGRLYTKSSQGAAS
jgi:SM-20-related protein